MWYLGRKSWAVDWLAKIQKMESMKHQLQIVSPNDNNEFITVEFSKAELKRLYNIVYQKHEKDIEQKYTSVKIEALREKLRYFIDE